MRSLFLRIFLFFWVAMATVAIVLIVTSPLFTRARPAVERWQRGAERSLEERLASAADHLARGEPVGGRRRGGGPHGHPVVHLFTPGGAPLDGFEPPEEMRRFARRVAEAGEERSERSSAMHMLGRPARAPDGSECVLVAVAMRPPRLIDLLEPAALAWRLALLTAVVGVVCFWLARYLSAPVGALRGAVRRLADGDLTARVAPAVGKRRDEIGDLGRDFDAMAERLESLMNAQRRLVRDVSHELRSPLARLQVALELARRRAGAEAGEALERIDREAGRLEEMVEQLLTLSRLEAGEGSAGTEEVDLIALARGVTEDAAFEASNRGVAVTFEGVDACLVRGDAAALRSALDNVLRNAVGFSVEGQEVKVSVGLEGGGIAVRVGDQGPGVPEENLEDLFEPFFRVEESRDRSRGGAGLGLAIAARVVRLHGGSVTAANRSDGGLEITVRLPLAEGVGG